MKPCPICKARVIPDEWDHCHKCQKEQQPKKERTAKPVVAGDITSQFIQHGIKESPVAMVHRLYRQVWEIHEELNGLPPGKRRSQLSRRQTVLMQKIKDICKNRKIGNPLDGEDVEWKMG